MQPASYDQCPLTCYEQKRTFLNFNFFHRNERVEKEADMDPGLEKMMELAKRERMRARMPPLEDVIKALTLFFESKAKRKSPITDHQARLALQSVRYCLAEAARPQLQEEPELEQQAASSPPFRRRVWRPSWGAAKAMQYLPEQLDQSHAQLAELLYEKSLKSASKNLQRDYLVNYVRILTSIRRAHDARLLIEQHGTTYDSIGKTVNPDSTKQQDEFELETAEDDVKEDEATTTKSEHNRVKSGIVEAWTLVLEGFVREANEAEVQRTLSKIYDLGIGDREGVPRTMIRFCIQRNYLIGVRQWWDQYRQTLQEAVREDDPKQRAVLKDVLMWCLERKELDAGHEIVRDLMKSNPPKTFWDAVFVWAAGTGKGVDEINRMMSVMEKSNETIADETNWRIADIETINALVEFAVKRKDPYMAERFITLGQSRNIEPNARTYVLQMEYRLSVQDIDGALIAYKGLQSMDTSANEDLPIVNKLIVALCNTHRHDFDTIMNVAADLSDRRATFEAETVAALTLLHLNRDEHTDVMDLLNTYAYHYSTAGRELVRNTLLTTALDPKTPTARAWNSYLLIQDIFDETPRPERTQLMETFIARERADMGVRIFQQMRAHSRPDTIPTIDTYVAAFLALAKIRDLNALEIVHNQLKLDFNVVATTYCYNALMLAYTACGDPEAGLRFWNNIVASKEGPSYNSIHIALRACEKTAFGDLKAREIWSLLRRRNVDLDHNLWCSYLASLCGNGNVDQAINAAEEAEEKGEVVVDEFLIGSLCDSTPKHEEKQAMIEEWAADGYPEMWEKLNEVVGFEELPTGVKRFRVDRRVSP